MYYKLGSVWGIGVDGLDDDGHVADVYAVHESRGQHSVQLISSDGDILCKVSDLQFDLYPRQAFDEIFAAIVARGWTYISNVRCTPEAESILVGRLLAALCTTFHAPQGVYPCNS